MVRLGVGDLLGHQCNYSFYLQTSRVSSRCSTPGTDKVGKCPAVAGGGGLSTAGIDGCITSTNQVHSKGPRNYDVQPQLEGGGVGGREK